MLENSDKERMAPAPSTFLPHCLPSTAPHPSLQKQAESQSTRSEITFRDEFVLVSLGTTLGFPEISHPSGGVYNVVVGSYVGGGSLLVYQ